MNFGNYAKKLVPLINFDTFTKAAGDFKKESRLTDFQGEM